MRNRQLREGMLVEYINYRWILGPRCYNTSDAWVLLYPNGSEFGWADASALKVVTKLDKALE